MNIKSVGIYFEKMMPKTAEKIAKRVENRYLSISPELQNLSPETFEYLNGLKSDIVTFAKANKVKIEISPHQNYESIHNGSNMDVFQTSAKNIKKGKRNDLEAYIDTNKNNGIFIVSPPFEQTKAPFADQLFSHLNLVVENLKKLGSF